MKYRKKPVVIDAFLWEGNRDMPDAPEWYNAAIQSGKLRYQAGSLFIATLEGEMEAVCGDMIIQGVKGEIYPCKPDIFEMTYERA